MTVSVTVSLSQYGDDCQCHCVTVPSSFCVFKSTLNRRTLGEALGGEEEGGDAVNKKKITAVALGFKDFAEC